MEAMMPTNSNPAVVGQRIYHLRESEGLSQASFAARIGVTPSALANWEQGRQRPGIDAAERMVEAFDVTLDWLMLGREQTLKVGVKQKLDAALRNRAS